MARASSLCFGPGRCGLSETAYSDGSNLDIVDAVADRVMACNADRTRFRQAGSPSHFSWWKFQTRLIRLRPGDFGETRPASPPREDAAGGPADLKSRDAGPERAGGRLANVSTRLE